MFPKRAKRLLESDLSEIDPPNMTPQRSSYFHDSSDQLGQ